jgi:hypothetical protein
MDISFHKINPIILNFMNTANLKYLSWFTSALGSSPLWVTICGDSTLISRIRGGKPAEEVGFIFTGTAVMQSGAVDSGQLERIFPFLGLTG